MSDALFRTGIQILRRTAKSQRRRSDFEADKDNRPDINGNVSDKGFMMRRMRSVKVVATLGPASETYEVIRGLFEAGADVFRLNMSHGSHEEIREKHQTIRDIERDTGRPIGILADLQGPKLRCGVFANEDGEELVEGAAFRFDLDETPGDATRVCLPHKEIFEALEVGSTLLVNDGKIRLSVTECGSNFAVCEVKVGGDDFPIAKG